MTPAEKKKLSQQAHHLKPVVMIGNQGLTPPVHKEIERALNDHELIKIRISGQDRDERKALAQTIISEHDAYLIKTIGNIIVIYREKQDS